MNQTSIAAPDRDQLVKLLEFEIKRCDDQKKETGINPWLLYAAIAGLLWQAVSTYSDTTDWPSVAIVWAVVVVIIDIGSPILRQLGRGSPSSDNAKGPRFYSASKLLSGSRLYLLLVGLQFGLAMTVVISAAIVTDWKVYLALAICVIHFAMWLLVLVFTFFDIPMAVPTTLPSVGRQLVFCIFTLADIFAIAVLLLGLRHTLTLMGPSDLKLALVGFALGQVGVFLVSHQVENPLRQNLINLRRAIGLGEVDSVDATTRLDLMLFGSQVTAYLQTTLQSYLDASENMKRAQNAVINAMNRSSESLHRDATEEVLSESSIAIDETKTNVIAAATAMNRLESAKSNFEIRASLALSMDSRAQPEVDALRSRMREYHQKVKATVPDIEKSMTALLTAEQQFREKYQRKLMNL